MCVRCVIGDLEAALRTASRLPRTDYDSALNVFRHHTHEAIHALNEYAKVTAIEEPA